MEQVPLSRRSFLKASALAAVQPQSTLGAVTGTTWRILANPQFGSWPLHENILADWAAGRAWRDAAADGEDRGLALRVRLELVASGSRGAPDLDGFGPWNAVMPRGEFKRRWAEWKPTHQLLFNLEWTKNPLLAQVTNWLGYWNIDRTSRLVQLQSYVMDVANPAYQAWLVPRVLRAFGASGADALMVGVKWDRFEMPTAKLSVPGGVLNRRTGDVEIVNDFPDTVAVTATPGFSQGMCEILRQCGVPFFTALQLLPEPPKTTWNLAEYNAACAEWIGDLAPLWMGHWHENRGEIP